MEFNESEATQAAIPKIGFMRLPQVLAVIPVGKSTWWAGVKSGIYPKSVKLSPNCTAWRAEEIRNLMAKIASTQSEAK